MSGFLNLFTISYLPTICYYYAIVSMFNSAKRQ